MSKKSHHFLTLWPWPLTYDLEKLIRSGHYHYQCVYQIWKQSIPWFLSYRVNTIAGGGRRATGGGRLRRKTITSPDPSDTGDIITSVRPLLFYLWSSQTRKYLRQWMNQETVVMGADNTGHILHTMCSTHLPKCHICASVNWISTSANNGLSHIRRQAII